MAVTSTLVVQFKGSGPACSGERPARPDGLEDAAECIPNQSVILSDFLSSGVYRTLVGVPLALALAAP